MLLQNSASLSSLVLNVTAFFIAIFIFKLFWLTLHVVRCKQVLILTFYDDHRTDIHLVELLYYKRLEVC